MANQTVQCILRPWAKTAKEREEISREIWELMSGKYNSLTNQLLKEVATSSNFQLWKETGCVNADDLKNLWTSIKAEPCYGNLPPRFATSARLMVHYTYKSWFALQKERRNQLYKTKRWLEVVKNDDELVQMCESSLDVIRSHAEALLIEFNRECSRPKTKKKEVVLKKVARSGESIQGQRQNESSIIDSQNEMTVKGYSANERDIYNLLYKEYYETDNFLRKAAISHLIKNKLQINTAEENIERFAKRVSEKNKQCQRLEEQLESRLPKGRLWVEDDLLEYARCFGIPEEEAEWFVLKSAVGKQNKALPYPIIFGSNTDLIWSERNACNSKSSKPKKILVPSEDAEYSPVRRRICVHFSGLDKKYVFEILCNRRQLSIFQQLMKDWQIYSANKREDPAGLMLLCSATLLWKASEHGEAIGHRKTEIPWKDNQLYLHCTIHSDRLTKEGTEQVQENKRAVALKSVATLEEKIENLKAAGKSTENDQNALERKLGTVRRLSLVNNPFNRPSKPPYQGQDNVLLAVSLGSSKLATAVAIDVITGKVLECRGIHCLLGKEKYKVLINKRHQRRKNTRRQSRSQQEQVNRASREMNRGQHIDRELAKAIVDFAKEYKASSIVLPDMKGYRERQQSEIAVLAEQEASGWKWLEKKIAKKQNIKIHGHSYNRLTKSIVDKAAGVEIPVEFGQQPICGSSQDQAREMALVTYRERQAGHKNSVSQKRKG